MLLGSKPLRHEREKKEDKGARDIEEGADRRPLLLGRRLPSTVGDKGTAFDDPTKRGIREAIGRTFGSAYNSKFADDAELAVRAAFFVVVLGLPFLTPRNEVSMLDYLMEKGVYTNSVVIFFVYNLGKTTGSTIMTVVCGLRGTLLAVVNTWLLYLAFPDGVTESSPPFVFWTGVANGVLFVSLMLCLNWQVSTMIFAVSNFVFFWMSFLQPGEDHFQCPFTDNFEFLGNVGVNSMITVAVGGLLCIMVTLVPYPRWAQFEAESTAKELVHHLPLLWRTLAEYVCEEKPNAYRGDQILRHLERLSRLTSTMSGHIGNSWYECFGRKQWHYVRRILTALERIINESYDRIYSAYSITSSADWSPAHAELAKRIQPFLLATITEVEVLLQLCFHCGFDGVVTEVEEKALKNVCVSVRAKEAAFTRAFTEARNDIAREQLLGNEKTKFCMDQLLAEHVFGLNFSSFVRSALGFAEDLIQQRHDPNHLPRVTEIPAISSLWDRSVFTDPEHLNFALRAAASILSGFAVGFVGYGDIFSAYDASIACTASVLLSKFVGSAVVKNLGRIQGVVLGSIIGQIVHAFFESCEGWSVASLAACLFLYAVATLFTYYNSTDFSYLGCLLAGFGCGQMLLGGCGVHNMDKVGGYDKISTTVCATSLIVLFDFVFSPGRASDFANKALGETVDVLESAFSRHFDSAVETVRFHKGELHDKIAQAEAMGREAMQEPRVWRTPWKGQVFSAVIQSAYRVRYTLATMEYSMADGFKDGGRKNAMLLTLQEASCLPAALDVLRGKLLAVRTLLGFFAHETQGRFPGFDDPLATHAYRFELLAAERALAAELATHPSMEWQEGGSRTLEDDPLAQACLVIGSMNSVLAGLRELQHAVLRDE